MSFASPRSEKGRRRSDNATTPLSVDAELPLAAGDVTPRLSCGPVFPRDARREGRNNRLFDDGKATASRKGLLALAAAGDAPTFDGQPAARLASDPPVSPVPPLHPPSARCVDRLRNGRAADAHSAMLKRSFF
jgi:hypothetical protein